MHVYLKDGVGVKISCLPNEQEAVIILKVYEIILGTKPKSVHMECASGQTNIQHMFC